MTRFYWFLVGLVIGLVIVCGVRMSPASKWDKPKAIYISPAEPSPTQVVCCHAGCPGFGK